MASICCAQTKAGNPCKRKATPFSTTCHLHAPKPKAFEEAPPPNQALPPPPAPPSSPVAEREIIESAELPARGCWGCFPKKIFFS